MGGAGRRQALRPRRRTSAQGERVVGDLGDGEATVAGRGNELGDPLLDRSRPLLIVTLIGFGVPKPATGGPQAAVGAFPAPGYPGTGGDRPARLPVRTGRRWGTLEERVLTLSAEANTYGRAIPASRAGRPDSEWHELAALWRALTSATGPGSAIAHLKGRFCPFDNRRTTP
jgi:hypothetical protein